MMNSKLKTQHSKLAVIVGALFLALAANAQAQQTKKIPRIGYLHPGSTPTPRDESFRQGLRDVGYVEGRNILIEYRYAAGEIERFPALAEELARSNVDVIVAVSSEGARAAKEATKTIPIVMVSVGADPVEAGLVKSLAHPGGNITGFTTFGVDVASKRLELFKEVVPRLVSVAILYDPDNRANLLHLKEAQTSARQLALTLHSWAVRDAADFEKIFAAIEKAPPDGLYVPAGPLMYANEKRIASFASKSRLPSAYASREAVEGGGLLSYAARTEEPFRRAAVFVDKILKGAKPADLPVEQPTKFEMVINLKTAKQIGLTIPPNVLARADKVIK
ncbi:MAG TPA: ABC transporter substrate-binding protein [Candidatus Binatia bacterium]|nr:ABC transporter substrate-binding protein [Candidatus Binatia bacterium]